MSKIADFYKNINKQETSKNYLVEGYVETDDMIQAQKDMNKLRSELNKKEAEYTIKRNLAYSENYTPCQHNPVISYTGRGSDTMYFDGITGTPLAENYVKENNIDTYEMETKNEPIEMITGFCYDIGCAIVRRYMASIPQNGLKINLKFIEEYIWPILTDMSNPIIKTYARDRNGVVYEKTYVNISYNLKQKSANEFLQNMYEIDRDFDLCKYKLSYDLVRQYSSSNPSFENIIKYAPVEDIYTFLTKIPAPDKPLSVNALLGLTKEEYNDIVNHGALDEWIEFLFSTSSKQSPEIKTNINKTTKEWVDFIIDCKNWEENLNFYSVRTGSRGLWYDLCAFYAGTHEWGYSSYVGILNKYYKFGKFCKYVVDESINQGFSSIESFCSTLKDYVAMCSRYGTKPTLSSSDLIKAHNIVKRNHQLTFTLEQTEKFVSKYKGFKPTVIEDYIIVAPENPFDMQKEGDNLNHCIAFYIKKVIDDECKIVFLRDKDHPDESLVTVEIRDGAIVQAKGMLNRDITEEERDILREYADKNKLGLVV